MYCKEKYEALEKHSKKQTRINDIKAGSETEGVYREAHSHISVPRPQEYHTYC
jgi:hypothetical protein